MGEVSCENCRAACCKGNPLLTMQLTDAEAAFMRAGGNYLITIASAEDQARQEVIYPAGIQINQARGTYNWLVDPQHPFEPLPAGFGRYALIGSCKYLLKENGLERCGVYGQRPRVCRDFEVGSAKCLILRALQDVPLPNPKPNT